MAPFRTVGKEIPLYLVYEATVFQQEKSSHSGPQNRCSLDQTLTTPSDSLRDVLESSCPEFPEICHLPAPWTLGLLYGFILTE
jgi:hypothetical protein